jgi:HSP20 family protein
LHPLDEIKEAADAFGLVVHLPGVAKEDLEITAEDDVLRIVGRRGWKCPESWIPLYRESTDVPSELVLRHDHALALERVRAELKDGVLRVSLPKTETVKPRKIAVA